VLLRLDRLLEPMLTLPRPVKRAIVFATDVALCLFTVWIAYYLRLNDWVSLWHRGWPAAVLSLTALPIFSIFGLYRSVLRHMSGQAFAVIAQAVLCYGLLFSAIVMTFGIPGVPRTIGVIQPLLMLVSVIASRVAAQYWLGQRYRRHLGDRTSRRQVVIYGAGSAGRQLATALGNSSKVQLVGFIDDDRNLQGGVVCGVRIWRADELTALVRDRAVEEILLAMPSASRQRRAQILSEIQSLGIAVRTLPDLLDIAHGKVAVGDLRPVEIEDLLGRDSVAPDARLLARKVRGHRIMVTGAGGSIGSELCRQIAEIRPSVLLLIEASEYALYTIHQELIDRGYPDIEIVPLMGSVCDEARMSEIVATWRPDTIYHAAAYKHVPLVEHNVIEGVRNNALGTLTLALVARRHGVANFVLVSTDKAVRPTNVMGASKRLAEMILQAMATEGGETCFAMVRFGNVLGSSGSVVPLFRAQIAAGGPITVTHPDITRYFMTIPEAAQLVVQAGAMARGGEVFVLDMGEPIRIHDLAVRMVELSGLHIIPENGGEGDIAIRFTGLRPGEKLYEELLIGDNPSPTQHPLIMTANEAFLPWPELQGRIKQMQVAIDARDVLLTRHLLAGLVTDYTPAVEVVDWINTGTQGTGHRAGEQAAPHARH
jgi:FlaA1/EpsC-like NDP-sugar epimerase